VHIEILKILLVFAFVLAAASFTLSAQETESSIESGSDLQWGVGLRFPPSTIAYTHPFLSDSALLSALVGRLWIGDRLGLEASGWIHQMRDSWSRNMNRVVGAGVLYKLVNREWVDFMMAARGLSYVGRSTSQGYDCVAPPPSEPSEPEPEPDPAPNQAAPVPPYCGPPYEVESGFLTLAGMLTAGIEWTPTRELALDLEFGLIYSQTISENNYPPRPYPVDEPRPVVPPPPGYGPGSEAFSSSQLGLVVTLSVIYQF